MGLFRKKGRLNPNQRGRKYAYELKKGVECSHTGRIYHNQKGEVFPLSSKQKTYRHGYLDARRDNANSWKNNQARKRNRAYTNYGRNANTWKDNQSKNRGRAYTDRTNPRFKWYFD